MSKHAKEIILGFEVGSGRAVNIPLRHTIITGQTQEAGKTTALEALIERSGLRAITFVTKRGEGSFRNARRIPPYFREQADWQFVASILEASRGEKLKFERAWIIRASRGAQTLAQVQSNVREAMKTAKGMSADVYLTLDAYLDAVVPQIAQVKWAKTVELSSGINAMDLTALNEEMQHLVIRSTIHWIAQKESETVVVVPEAWKFIPQGRGTPVKLEAEKYIRQGAGLKNYLWLDSQDIAGVEKIILKSVPLWILGVQREANEIKRTIDNIPAGIKRPSAADVATLQLGQFYVCWGTNATKTYVQPAWMSEDDARQIAMGQQLIDDEKRPRQTESEPEPAREESPDEQEIMEDEDDMSKEDVDGIRSDLKELTNAVGSLVKTIGKPLAHAAVISHAPSAAGGIVDEEAMYQRFKERLTEEAPVLLKVLGQRPELEVKMERVTIQADGKSLKGRVGKLLAQGFMDATKKHNEIYKELNRTGAEVNSGNLATAIKDFVKLGFLTVEEDGFRSVKGMKARVIEA